MKQSSISLHFENTASTGGLQCDNEREPGQRHSNKNTAPTIFLETERRPTGGERVKTVWRRIQGELKRFGKDAVKMVEATVQPGDITMKAKKTAIEALERGHAPKEMYGEENIAVIHVDDNGPVCIVISVPLTMGESISGESDFIAQRKTQRTSEAMQERSLSPNLHVWSRKAMT